MRKCFSKKYHMGLSFFCLYLFSNILFLITRIPAKCSFHSSPLEFSLSYLPFLFLNLKISLFSQPIKRKSKIPSIYFPKSNQILLINWNLNNFILFTTLLWSLQLSIKKIKIKRLKTYSKKHLKKSLNSIFFYFFKSILINK